jgi:aryl-alcohol dehydrogenase-like predicted oxidoreductase
MTPVPCDGLHLGLGTVSIGRPWGVSGTPTPSTEEAADLIAAALQFGIKVFDTAPAYASSEERLGRALGTLPRDQRRGLTIMTKMGEHWNGDKKEPFVDHRRETLKNSVDRSLSLLGQIDLMQIHKATVEVLAHADTVAAIDYARACGIPSFGASVTSIEAGRFALETGLYAALQFPFNLVSFEMEPLLEDMAKRGTIPIINRPFAMGGLVVGAPNAVSAADGAFRFLKDRVRMGVILTGTANQAHLRSNIDSFLNVTGSAA